jgi:nucleoid DNA-binding protein
MSRTKKEYRTYSRENYDRFLRENNISEKELPYPKYCKNLEVCNWMFVEYALRTGQKVQLPHGFGTLAVNKKKLKMYKEHNGKKYINLRTDWKKTREIGKKVYHTNEHSDGYNFRWMWFSEDAKLFLSDLYVFKPGRYVSRAINKYVRKVNAQYKELYLEWLKPNK